MIQNAIQVVSKAIQVVQVFVLKGVFRMCEKKIKLPMDEAREFVSTASKCDFDINVFYNRVIIDAKSILGVLGLDFNQTLTVQYAGENDAFENLIHRYAVCG